MDGTDSRTSTPKNDRKPPDPASILEQVIETRNRAWSNVPGTLPTERFIGGLPRNIGKTTLEYFFKRLGLEVLNIRMKISRFTGKNPGFAFVEFRSSRHAYRAMQLLNGREFRGQILSVQHVESKQLLPPKLGGPESQLCNQPGVHNWPEERGRKSTWYSERGQRLTVRGLPLRPMKRDDFRRRMVEHFKGFTVENISPPKPCRNHMHNLARPPTDTHCFIDFATAEEAEKARKTLNLKRGPWNLPLFIKKGKPQGKKKSNTPSSTKPTPASTEPTLDATESMSGPIEPRPAPTEPMPASVEPPS
ncbi:uncharacterized protein DSM5745_00036 [Aspergillus mulundensis]|uniref:RRM domain-containing protein n=1 Tax=Aspergillus mulundensis TaxID=1810919 RepID=A0A3D8T2E2_9EURO|nr:hypothetical protein DSM5745_00036 [Aspergillus mulundensis]RDW92714.1 hypothetical protein DSM5745_00036 [Aspergillus mulundensis]